MLLIPLLICLLVKFACSDEEVFVDSDAAFVGNSEVNLLLPPTIINEVVTSNIYDAGTVNPVYITYIGQFSSSGPHSLGGFMRGSTRTVVVQLTRKIGNLVKIVLQTNATDNWLMSEMHCQMEQINYELRGPRIWLDALNPLNEALYENGFSASAQIDLPSSSHIEITVTDQILVYSYTGVLPSDGG